MSISLQDYQISKGCIFLVFCHIPRPDTTGVLVNTVFFFQTQMHKIGPSLYPQFMVYNQYWPMPGLSLVYPLIFPTHIFFTPTHISLTTYINISVFCI